MAYPTREQMQQTIREFVGEFGMAQLVTIDKHGAPSARTLGARLIDDLSIDIPTNKKFQRWRQVEANPNMLITWVGTPPPGTDAKYPRVIYAKGTGRILQGEELRAWYLEREAQGKGWPNRTADTVVESSVVIHFTPSEFRAEGFAAPGTDVSFAELTSGFHWRA